MRKFAFINPGKNIEFSTAAPVNLALLAAILEKNGIETIIIDEIAGQDIKTRLSEFKPDMVGVTATTAQFPDAIRAIKFAKELGIFSVIGGRHVLIQPEDALPYFDMVIQGEAENLIVDIAMGRITEKILKCEAIDNLNNYPIPAYHLLDMDFYANSRKRIPYSFLNFSPIDYRLATMLTSRGCPFDCIFCHNSWKGLKFRCLEPERVIEEIKYLIEKFDIQSVFFIDDDLFFNRKRLEKICDLLIENNIKLVWGCNARVTDINEETLIKAKNAGCKQITFGFESGSQRVLDVLNKKATVEQASNAIKMCNEIGLEISGTFILGTPTETLEDIVLTKKFILDHDIDSIGITIMTPFPGTKLWEWCKEQNFIPPNFNWSDFNFQKIPIRTNEIFTKEELYWHYRELQNIVAIKNTQKAKRDETMWLRFKSICRNFGKVIKRALKEMLEK